MNIYIEEKLAQQRQRDWLRSAERDAQAKAVRSPRSLALLSRPGGFGASVVAFVRRLRAGERLLGGTR